METRADNKRSLLIASTAFIIVLLANALPRALADKQSYPFTLTILHTNDLHAHDQSFQDRGKTVGGFARLGHLARQLKKNTPNCLLVDAGDIFQGTPMFTRYQGETEVELLNRMGYDLYTIGNHEFDSGGVNLAKQLSHAKFKVLNCNLDTSALPQLTKIVKESEIVNFGDKERVGFVGVITPDIEALSLNRDGVVLKRNETGQESTAQSDWNRPGLSADATADRTKAGPDAGTKIPATNPSNLSWIEPVRRTVEKLEKQGIDKIILVTHCGVDADKQLAQALPQVDAIIGGHSHTRLASPIIVNHADGSTVTIVQTGSYGRNLGKLKLSFDKEGRVLSTDTRYELLPIDSRVPEDGDLAAYVQKMAEPLKSLRETILCRAEGDFDNFFRSMKNDSALGDLICDAFYEAGQKQAQGTEITFENRGGIRSRIDRGAVNMEKVEELLPFDNHLVFATVSGAQIRRALEHSMSGATAGKFLDVHGLKLAWDPGAEAGKRLVFVLAMKNGDWQPLDDNADYKIAMTDYSFKGGEGYDFSGAKDVHNTECRLNKYFQEYLLEQKTIKPSYGDRIVAVNSEFGRAILTKSAPLPFKGLHFTVYTGSNLGVEAYDRSNSSTISVPLSDPKVVARASSFKNLLETLTEKSCRSKLAKFVVVVAEGYKKNPGFGESAKFRQVCPPLKTDELIKINNLN